MAPNGELYVSPELLNVDAFHLGDVHSGIRRDAQRTWVRSTHLERMKPCGDCWVRNFCGGGSRSASFAHTGDVRQPCADACRLIRRTYEAAMGTCLELADRAPDRLHDRYGSPEAA